MVPLGLNLNTILLLYVMYEWWNGRWCGNDYDIESLIAPMLLIPRGVGHLCHDGMYSGDAATTTSCSGGALPEDIVETDGIEAVSEVRKMGQ